MVFDRLDSAGAGTGHDIAAGADAQRAVPFLRTPWIERDGQLSARKSMSRLTPIRLTAGGLCRWPTAASGRRGAPTV
jgi:hypothetical protein